MKSIDETGAEIQATLDARAAGQDAAYREALSVVHDELRVVAERSRRQIPALEAEQREALRFAEQADHLAGQIASLGDRSVAQDLSNWAADIRTPFQGSARSGIGGGAAPLAEAREHLAIYDDARAFARYFPPALLADVYGRRITTNNFRAAMGRVDGCLGSVRRLRGQIERLLQDYRNADPSPAAVRTVPVVTRPAPAAPIPVETAFNLGPE